MWRSGVGLHPIHLKRRVKQLDQDTKGFATQLRYYVAAAVLTHIGACQQSRRSGIEGITLFGPPDMAPLLFVPLHQVPCCQELLPPTLMLCWVLVQACCTSRFWSPKPSEQRIRAHRHCPRNCIWGPGSGSQPEASLQALQIVDRQRRLRMAYHITSKMCPRGPFQACCRHSLPTHPTSCVCSLRCEAVQAP